MESIDLGRNLEIGDVSKVSFHLPLRQWEVFTIERENPTQALIKIVRTSHMV